MSEIVRRPAADRDLVAAYRFYAREAGLRVADRFFDEAEATIARLAKMPGLGTSYDPDEPSYSELRYFPVSRFRSFVVFYRPITDGIEVFRVLHGARNFDVVLAEEFGIQTGDDALADDGYA
jgi:toxin ParE1/3/4